MAELDCQGGNGVRYGFSKDSGIGGSVWVAFEVRRSVAGVSMVVVDEPVGKTGSEGEGEV